MIWLVSEVARTTWAPSRCESDHEERNEKLSSRPCIFVPSSFPRFTRPAIPCPGYSAGLLVCALMVGRIAGAYFWGLAADRYGRRPVVLISLWTMAIFAVAFGFSTTYFWAVTFRYLGPCRYQHFSVWTGRRVEYACLLYMASLSLTSEKQQGFWAFIP